MTRRYLPRPALGRRPWFALRRRALMRRRFPFAIDGEGTSGPPLSILEAHGDRWSSGPVAVARRAADRRRGLQPACGPFGMVFRGSSVVGAGMKRPLRVIGVSGAGRVVGAWALRPRGIVVSVRSRFMIEVPLTVPPPPPGMTLALAPILGSWPAR